LLGENLTVSIPKSGSGALIYYQGYSESEVAEFVKNFLKKGMVFYDIGAHIGEYTLLAAYLVGPTGEVHAFEPNSEIFQLLARNVKMNKFSNVKLNNYIVCDQDGEGELEIYRDPSLSSLKIEGKPPRLCRRELQKIIKVPSVCLDSYWAKSRRKIDLVKVDVEGAEFLVFKGARKIMELPKDEAPVWIFEYRRENYARFGCSCGDILDFFKMHGYEILVCPKKGKKECFMPIATNFGEIEGLTFIATKNLTYSKPILRSQ
jgi:FkbM family methyltransferase